MVKYEYFHFLYDLWSPSRNLGVPVQDPFTRELTIPPVNADWRVLLWNTETENSAVVSHVAIP
jgi:hypothetical protein